MSNVDICPQCQHILPFEKNRVFDSPLAQLSGTNHTPNDAERYLIEEVVADVSLSIRILEKQISCLRKTTDRLKLYRREHEVLLSKFRHFPAEILEQIFQAYVDSSATRKVPLTSDDLDFKPGNVRGMPRSSSRMAIPLTIASVCRRWRMVALSMSSLWNNIHLSLGLWKLGWWENVTPRFLQRAGRYRLNIDLDLDDWNNAERGCSILETLGSKAEQWKEAQFMLSMATLGQFTTVMAKLNGRLPELEFLSIGMTAKDSSLFVRLPAAPKLRTLQLVNIRCDHLILPWLQLRELVLFQVDWRHTLDLLKICPNLEILRYEVFDLLNLIQLDNLKDALCRHQRLSSLALIMTPRNCLFLNTLELPALSNLNLTVRVGSDGEGDCELYPSQALGCCLSRAQCTLQTISLSNTNVSIAQWTEFLALVPNLTTLKLTESGHVFYNDLLELLALTKDVHVTGPGPVLPHLRHLEYTFYARSSRHPEYPVAFKLVSNLIRSRQTPDNETTIVQPLQSVKVIGPRPDTDPEQFPAYNELIGYHRKELSVEVYFFSPPEHLTLDISTWNGRHQLWQARCITIAQQINHL